MEMINNVCQNLASELNIWILVARMDHPLGEEGLMAAAPWVKDLGALSRTRFEETGKIVVRFDNKFEAERTALATQLAFTLYPPSGRVG